MSDAPVLVLLAFRPCFDDGRRDRAGTGWQPQCVLGLSLIERATLVAAAAGYAVRSSSLGGAGATNREWRPSPIGGASPRRSPPHCRRPWSLRAAILGETGWLERLASTRIEPAGLGIIPNRIVVFPASSASNALDALAAGRVQDMAEVEARLIARLGPPARILADVDPLIVETLGHVRAAERRLLKSLVKDTDEFMARHVERPISLQISRALAATAITPNQMSLISIAVGICGGPFSCHRVR